ncbi:MAG TPA: twin-arginine translocation signal domain-containing protein [Ktedonobacteraceae bacterium]|nr:twin-arginine translocation signal domain-containing protein [Ktedonobacteraceae bacterium]
MAKLTRRGFIKQASVGAGLLGVLASGAAPLEAAQASGTVAKATTTHTAKIATGEPLMLVVSNPASGKVTLLHGEHERTINNPALVRRLQSL